MNEKPVILLESLSVHFAIRSIRSFQELRQESVFFIAEALTVFHWGWASDRYGRRAVLLLGPLGLSIASCTFGLSRSFWLLVVSRCFQGAFNGNIGEHIAFSQSIIF
jgi:MFS family permease